MGKKTIKDLDYPLKKSKKLDAALEAGSKTGSVAVMSPKQYLKHAKRLPDTKEDRLLIEAFKSRMQKGKKFKPLKLLGHNQADGRHRATAAEEIGIKEVPVIDYRESGLKKMKGVHSVSQKGSKVGKIEEELRKERASGGQVNAAHLPLEDHDPNAAFRKLISWSFAVAPLFGRRGHAAGGKSVSEAIELAKKFASKEDRDLLKIKSLAQPPISYDPKNIVRVPIEELEHGESALSGGKLYMPGSRQLIEEYASRETPIPPIEAGAPSLDNPKWMVSDGSHRLEAAKMRGQTHVDVIPWWDKEDPHSNTIIDYLTKNKFANGGTADIEAAIRAAKDISSRKEMEHEKGFRGDVEFAPLSVEEPLTHARLPLGSYPKGTTEVIEPALQAVSEIAPYFTPAAPLAAARDVAVGLREGDPTNVAMSALGLPGKAAKAASIGASALMPSEAEASPIDKALSLAKRVVSQAGEHGDFIAKSARERDPRRWHDISKTVLSRPLGEMSAEHEILEGLPERHIIRPEDLEGTALIPALGDRTAGGSLLTRINEQKLDDPTVMQAGHSFMFRDAAHGPDKSVWASDPNIIKMLSNKAKAAVEEGYDPHLIYTAMGSRSGDYSHHMTDTLLNMFKDAKVTDDNIKEFNRQMRENTKNKWKAYQDFPGIESPDIAKYFYETGPAKSRTKFAELMGMGEFQKMGFPDVGAARFGITDPELLHALDYSAGRSIARLDPTGKIITDPAIPHKTYKHQLGAHPEGGYVGGFEHDVPFEVMNKEFIDKLLAEDAEKYSNPSQLAYTYRMNAPTVYATPEWVDRVSTWLEKKKRGVIP